MTKNAADNPAMRSPLGRVRGLGSARHGAQHWMSERLTAIALIPLSIYIVGTFFIYAVLGGYYGAHGWLHHPFAGAMMILFIIVGFHHAAMGIQVVIEDYVHHTLLKASSIIAVRFIAALGALLGIIAVAKIMLGV